MNREPLVLYVDDEEPNRIVFRATFGALFRVEVVASGEEALARMASDPPAIVIADQRMPGMPGCDLLSIVKVRFPDTVRVILTAYPDPEPMLDAINRANAARYLVKPWERRELTTMLTAAVEAFKLQQHLRALQLDVIEAQKLSALGSVSASLFHDMASPLTAIGCDAERLADLLGPLESGSSKDRTAALAELKQIARELMQGVTYLHSMVAGVRGYTRASAAQETDPQAAMVYAISVARKAVQDNGGLLEANPQPLPALSVTSTQLCQVLVNLLVNAAQALPGAPRPRLVRLEAAPRTDGVEFSVSDTGVGIAPDLLARLSHERITTKQEGDGTGLGLVATRKLIDTAGGTLAIESEVGKGTCVRFWLPLRGMQGCEA